MKKKSQVTLFVILGLLLLVGIALFFHLKDFGEEQTSVMQPHVDEVPHSFRSIQKYVLTCVEEEGKRAIKMAGEHGGYIDIQDPYYTTKSFQNSPKPTNSDVVYLAEETHPVPYYWYMESDNLCADCRLSTGKIPSLPEIEKQIAKFVDRNINECLGDMKQFKEMGYSINKEEPKTKVKILQGRVVVQTEYPIEASFNETATSRLENFGVDLQVPFLESYLLAIHLTTKEATDQYLETAAMTLVSYYSGLDPQKLPPIVHVDEGYDTVNWIKTAVRQKYTDLLSSYIPLFRVEETMNGREISMGSKYEKAYFGHTLLENNLSMKDTVVNFMFLDWPIHFDITPSRGELLQPSTFKNEYPFNMIPPTQTNHYEFFYDISFPVVVDISSSKAFKGDGFDFMFAMEGNIRDNKNLLRWHQGDGTIGPWNFDDVNYGVNENALPDINQSLKDRLEPKKSLMCDDNQKIVGPVKLKVKGSYTLQPIEGASVTFKCGNYKSCNMDRTDKHGTLETKIPLCKGGGILIEKEGFRPVILGNITTKLNESVTYDVTMQRLRVKTVQVRKIPYSALNGTEGIAYNQRKEIIDNETLELLPREKVILSFVKKKDDYYESEFTRSVEIKSNNTAELRLVPGEYQIRASLIDEKGIITKRVNRNYSYKTVTYPSVNMTPAMLGGARINSGSGLWKVSEAKLNKPKIEFYVINYEPPEIITDMQYMGNMDKHSKQFRLFLEPEFMD